MAKFGLFESGNQNVQQEYEGERMVIGEGTNAEFIYIVVGTGANRKVTGAIRLAPGQSVKEIK